MYDVDDREKVIRIDAIPQSSVGAPIPVVVSDGSVVLLAYYLASGSHSWAGGRARLVRPGSFDDVTAIVRFNGCFAHYFGAPNDEAFDGHPLAARGLEPYGAFEIEDSSWIRRLERMNSVHPNHSTEEFAELRHFVLSFHEELFECVCQEFLTIEVFDGSVLDAIPKMACELRERLG